MAASPEEIRFKIQHDFTGSMFHDGAFPCISELADLAVDTSLAGFEDPRVASLTMIESISGRQVYGKVDRLRDVPCERDGCDVEVSIDTQSDTVRRSGQCALEGYCTKADWENRKDDPESYKRLMKTSISKNSAEVASDSCPHIACTFHCGFSIDGYSGTGGECLQG